MAGPMINSAKKHPFLLYGARSIASDHLSYLADELVSLLCNAIFAVAPNAIRVALFEPARTPKAG